MKSIPVQELLVAPLALICAVVVYVAAILDVPQNAVSAQTAIAGASR
jgi:hypothetical protein